MATGVTITIAAQGSTVVGSTADSGTYFVAVQAQRGPTARPPLVPLASYGEVERVFGPAVPYSWLHNDARTYYEEAQGSGRMVPIRVVGANATKGSATLPDRGTSGGQPTLTLTASSEGAWSSGLSVTVTDSVTSGAVDLRVYLNGGADGIEEFLALPNMTALVQQINTGSEFVVAADLGSPTATDAAKLPAATTNPVPLSAGSDDRDSITASNYIAALQKLTEDYGPGIEAIPGQPFSTVATALATHAEAVKREAIVSTPPGYSVTQTQTAARSLRSAAGANRLIMPFPWVEIPDGAGSTVAIPPSGFVAGLRARQCSTTGPWDNPAGQNGVARFVTGTERDTPLTRAEIDALTTDAVSPIRESSGAIGPRLYGYRSLSADLTNWKFLKYAATLDLIAWQITQGLEQYVQATVDGRGKLLQSMETTVENVLAPIAEAGGLYARRINGQVVDPGYSIRIDDDEVNPPARLEQGEVDVQVYVRLSPSAELIRVALAKVTLTTSLGGA